MSDKGTEKDNSFNEENIVNDQIDLPSLFSILLDNFNLLISSFLAGLLLAFIIYISSENIFSSKSLIEIQQEQNMFGTNIPGMGNRSQNSLLAEVAIYKSAYTIDDVVKSLENNEEIEQDMIPSAGAIRSNLNVTSSGNSLITIVFSTSFSVFFSDLFLSQHVNFFKLLYNHSNTLLDTLLLFFL